MKVKVKVKVKAEVEAEAAMGDHGKLISRDWARVACREHWLHHPVLGDPSWDAFSREPGNPIHTGRPPYEWPVNGFLFRDPVSGRWYAYVSLYPRGYWPPPPIVTYALREDEDGAGWQPVGVVLEGSPGTFDGDGTRPGAAGDVSLVYEDGRYHLIYGWCDPDNQRGGLAYAWSDHPEGPFRRAEHPIHDDRFQPPLLDRYVRAYASTLIRRDNDWLILHMMSTPHNAGGAWALACMTAARPEGPYTPPALLLMPQSDVFHPALAEFYPQFAHDEYVYAPATSVALNRTFQTVFRAPIQAADRPEAWEIAEYGSAWHAEPAPAEAQGIWGQTFSGQVGPDGVLRAFFPSKTGDDVGTIHIARRPWRQPERDGFILSAPRGPAVAILPHHYAGFRLRAGIAASGAWALGWDCRAPLSPDRPVADATLHPLVRTRRVEWRHHGGASEIVSIDDHGAERLLATIALAGTRQPGEAVGSAGLSDAVEVAVERSGGSATLIWNGSEVWKGNVPAGCGRLELVAEAGTVLKVNRFEVDGMPEAAGQYWLSTEALAGAACSPEEWSSVDDDRFAYGIGHVSAVPGARAKWNIIGDGFRLYLPRGPEFGQAEVIVDGCLAATFDLGSPQGQSSVIVLEQSLPRGRHAVVLRAKAGCIPCDAIEVVIDLEDTRNLG